MYVCMYIYIYIYIYIFRSVGATLESIGWMSKGCAKICASLSPLLERALEVAVAALALVPRTQVSDSCSPLPERRLTHPSP
jgi:hypothetical protein